MWAISTMVWSIGFTKKHKQTDTAEGRTFLNGDSVLLCFQRAKLSGAYKAIKINYEVSFTENLPHCEFDPHADPHGEMTQRTQECRAGGLRLLPVFFSLSYMTCSMKLPMVWAASSCFCRVAWV